MKLMFIRHGDPDYSIDSLTPKGWREARCLADKLKNVRMDHIYVSPLGRAKDTAKVTLEAVGREAITLPWLIEFEPRIYRPDKPQGEQAVAWDWLPADWTCHEQFFDDKHWMEHPLFEEAGVSDKVAWIDEGIDSLLKDHGYERDGRMYKAVRANDDTLVFFCHFAVQCVILAHILNVSPMVLWHGTCAAPTSVTTLNTEERREGKAYFRMASFGDVSHLYAAGEPVAFAARFCECFSNEDERH